VRTVIGDWTSAVGDGWKPIVSAVLTVAYAKNIPILQVKEKFGTLRIYTMGGDEEFEKFVDLAERLSEITCEQCGARGKIRPGGWLKTLCDPCEEKSHGPVAPTPPTTT
jgi:hypothetical protein